jgi:chromosome segregation ATPase
LTLASLASDNQKGIPTTINQLNAAKSQYSAVKARLTAAQTEKEDLMDSLNTFKEEEQDLDKKLEELQSSIVSALKWGAVDARIGDVAQLKAEEMVGDLLFEG